MVVSTGVPYTFAIRCQASFPRTYVNEYCPSDDGERASQMNDKRPVLSITLVSTPDRGRSSSTVQKTHYFFFFLELYSAHFPFVEYTGGRDVNITLQQIQVLEVITLVEPYAGRISPCNVTINFRTLV